MNKELRLSRSIADYLYNNQVKVSPIELYGTTKTKIKLGAKSYNFYFKLDDAGMLHYSIDNKKWSGPFSERKLFRLDPFVSFTKSKGTSKFGKSKLIKRTLYNIFTLGQHLSYGLEHSNKMLVKDFLNKFLKSNYDEGGGALFWLSSKGGKPCIYCYENGGIFDDNVNTEGDSFPPRVMGSYYADAYAAYCFARRYKETKNKKYLDACVSSLKYVKCTYERYPKNFVWYHHDFKNPAYLETIELIRNDIDVKEFMPLINQLREDFYEPINVLALRLHWLLARKKLHDVPNSKISSYIRRIMLHQKKEGLILDTNKEDYKEAYDLTYHQYSLACLASALQYSGNKRIKHIFLNGIEFSHSMLMPNGEVSYVGRGANNIYHLASAYYSFKFAAKHYGLKQSSSGLNDMINYLSSWQLDDKSLPVAMNMHPESRMGWNHCRTPYNALVAYLLYKASDIKVKIIKHEPNKIFLAKESRYFRFSNKKYGFAFFSGSSESYPLSGDMHKSGVAGTAYLGDERGSLTLILDRNLKQDLLVTDLPSFILDGKLHEPIGDAKLSYEGCTLKYKKDYGKMMFERNYTFNESKIVVKTMLTFKADTLVFSDGLVKMPTNEYFSFKNLTFRNDKTAIKISGDLKLDSHLNVSSNPRGNGRIYLFNKLDNYRFAKGEIFSYTYNISFS